MSNLRVVSLQAQNILRLSAVEIQWDPSKSVLTVGGLNGAGKSSVLNAVAMALGGAALCPEEPIRRGESEGFVELNLGDVVVRREFYKEAAHRPACATRTVVDGVAGQTCDCVPEVETKSRPLTIRNAEGIKLGTPQAILDRAISKFAFDPLAFVNEEGKKQDEIMRKIVGLDLTDLEAKRKSAFERRTHFNRELKEAKAYADALPLAARDGAPAAELSMKAIADEMRQAEEYRQLADEADRAVETSKTRFAALEQQCQVRYARVQELHKQIELIQQELTNLEKLHQDEAKQTEALQITAQAARAVVPDVAAIRQKLTDAEMLNHKFRAMKEWEKAKANADEFERKANVEDEAVKAAEQAKADALKAAKFPVEGLGLSDNGVTFGGLPFKQASTSEQIRTSVAVGFALNPGLKLLLVRNGNALDEDSMKLVAAEADRAGGQILMEYVTRDAGEVSVMIEDGHVA